MLEPNENITEVLPSHDLVSDEYGNYYEIVGQTHKDGKLTELVVSHALYEIGYSNIIADDLLEKYRFKHVTVPIQDLLKSKIDNLNKSGRKIFSIRDFIENGTEVKYLDILSEHPRSKN